MKDESMISAAERILENGGSALKFPELWEAVKKELEIDTLEADRRIGHFYTDLSMSDIFVNIGENTWDLRKRYKYDDAHPNNADFYSDETVGSEDPEDEQEEKEYNASVRGGALVDDEEEGASEEEVESRGRASASDLLGISDENF